MPTQEMRMFDGSDTVVLYDELAFQDVLPFAWRPLKEATDPDVAAGLMERNARLLHAREALDQLGPVTLEKPDEMGYSFAAARREPLEPEAPGSVDSTLPPLSSPSARRTSISILP